MAPYDVTKTTQRGSIIGFRRLFSAFGRERGAAEVLKPTVPEQVAEASKIKTSLSKRSIDSFEGPRPSAKSAMFRSRIGGDILALNDRYEANLSHLGRRGARTGMLVGTIVGTIAGITIAALSLGVTIPLFGVIVGIGGQIVGFFIGLAIERLLQWRFARKHPEMVQSMLADARVLRAEIQAIAKEDPTYDPRNDLRNLDLFVHNVEATLGKALLELFSGLFRESPSAVFEVVRDVKTATGRGMKRMRNKARKTFTKLSPA